MVTNLICLKTIPLTDAIIIYNDLINFNSNGGVWPTGSAPQWAKDTAKALQVCTGGVAVFSTAWEVVARTFAKELGLPEIK